MTDQDTMLSVEALTKRFTVSATWFGKPITELTAVDDVSFEVFAGETLGIVGESGCGKSTLSRCIMQLLSPTRGTVSFEGRTLDLRSKADQLAFRRKVQFVFQDQFSSLNPKMTVADLVGEGLKIHKLCQNQKERNERVVELLQTVGLKAEHMFRYPHEFSGGQRQRIGIARALAVKPRLIVCDEPVSALDVSVQAQVVNLFQDLQKEFRLSLIFVAHDLSVVRHISDRVAVMYLGRIVEIGSVEEIYARPRHPYTQALLSAVPVPNPQVRKDRTKLVGEVPNPIDPPTGCHFHTRCPIRDPGLCARLRPELIGDGSQGAVACHSINSGDYRRAAKGRTEAGPSRTPPNS